jgi:hypothetical protein
MAIFSNGSKERFKSNLGFGRRSSVIEKELDLTTRGIIGGLGSLANDFGFNRRVTEFGANGAPSAHALDSWFGFASKGGKGYVHPVLEAPGKVKFATAATIDEATQNWGKYIDDAAESDRGLTAPLTRLRARIFHGIGGESSKVNRLLTRLGGLGTAFAPGMTAFGAISDATQGYKSGGITGAAIGAVGGYAKWAVTAKLISAALANPLVAIPIAAGLGGMAYAGYKMFDVRNRGNNYLRMGRMGGLSWNTGSTPGMQSQMASTIRQRGLMAMQHSRFNAMRALGNEGYMMSAPRSRYANSTAIYSQTPMLSY